ncbi:MAG TPA: toll/interleukin-1 receptor domain-containing protein [Longimicrobium sp.]|nr:toll/interleukin-1 receptor domain-containing protein [Longimicrobium sp.]
MKVAIFGSWPAAIDKNAEWKFFGGPDVFRTACRDLGRALARRGDTLIVESDRENVADRYVVEGYVERAASGGAGGPPRIDLASPRGVQRPFEAMAGSHPAWFHYHDLPAAEHGDPKWKSSHMRTLKLSEAVLTIGGLWGTYSSGSAAILAKRPLVPVANFGGASARLLHDLRQESHDPDFMTATTPLFSLWNSGVIDTALRLLTAPTPMATMALFVSHAHADQALATALVELIHGYFHVEASAIRCTSVDGYTLPPGVQVSEALRSEIENTEFLLALITPKGAASKYVLFELGAAWGLRGRAFPLLARGSKAGAVPGPFAERKSLNLAKPEDCFALLKALEASRLMRKKEDNLALISSLVTNVVTNAQQ